MRLAMRRALPRGLPGTAALLVRAALLAAGAAAVLCGPAGLSPARAADLPTVTYTPATPGVAATVTSLRSPVTAGSRVAFHDAGPDPVSVTFIHGPATIGPVTVGRGATTPITIPAPGVYTYVGRTLRGPLDDAVGTLVAVPPPGSSSGGSGSASGPGSGSGSNSGSGGSSNSGSNSGSSGGSGGGSNGGSSGSGSTGSGAGTATGVGGASGGSTGGSSDPWGAGTSGAGTGPSGSGSAGLSAGPGAGAKAGSTGSRGHATGPRAATPGPAGPGRAVATDPPAPVDGGRDGSLPATPGDTGPGLRIDTLAAPSAGDSPVILPASAAGVLLVVVAGSLGCVLARRWRQRSGTDDFA